MTPMRDVDGTHSFCIFTLVTGVTTLVYFSILYLIVVCYLSDLDVIDERYLFTCKFLTLIAVTSQTGRK